MTPNRVENYNGDVLTLANITDQNDATKLQMSSDADADYFVYFDTPSSAFTGSSRIEVSMRFLAHEHGGPEPEAYVTARLQDDKGDYNFGSELTYEWTFSVPDEVAHTVTFTIDQASITADNPGDSSSMVWLTSDVYTYAEFVSLLGDKMVLYITSGSGAPYLVDLLDVSVTVH